MKIKMHPADLWNLIKLKDARDTIKDDVVAGRLKRGDIVLSWADNQEKLTIEGKDIEI